MDGGAGDEAERPLEGDHAQAADEVDDLQRGDGSHGPVEGSREEVPEDLGPDEAFDRSGDLVCFIRMVSISLFPPRLVNVRGGQCNTYKLPL